MHFVTVGRVEEKEEWARGLSPRDGQAHHAHAGLGILLTQLHLGQILSLYVCVCACTRMCLYVSSIQWCDTKSPFLFRSPEGRKGCKLYGLLLRVICSLVKNSAQLHIWGGATVCQAPWGTGGWQRQRPGQREKELLAARGISYTLAHVFSLVLTATPRHQWRFILEKPRHEG